MTDDDVVSLINVHGSYKFPKMYAGRAIYRSRSAPKLGQLKRLVKEGRLIGATISVSPHLGPNGSSRPKDSYLEFTSAHTQHHRVKGPK